MAVAQRAKRSSSHYSSHMASRSSEEEGNRTAVKVGKLPSSIRGLVLVEHC